MKYALFFALFGVGCGSSPAVTPTPDAAVPAADASVPTPDAVAPASDASVPAPDATSSWACPEGQLDLDFAYADGRHVRECLAFEGTLLTSQCTRLAFGGITMQRTSNDPGALPNPPLPRFSVANEMNLNATQGTVSTAFTLTLNLDRTKECSGGARFCQFISLGPDPGSRCTMVATIPPVGERSISYRLTAPCQAQLINPQTSLPVSGGPVVTVHRADFRGSLRWVGDTGFPGTHDGGAPQCGTSL